MFDLTKEQWLVISLGLAILYIYYYFAIRIPKLPWSFTAKVVYVCDGDTVYVRLWYGRRLKLRLFGIDAPESEQKFGEESQKVLSKMIDARKINVQVIDRDVYGRLVSMISLNGDDVCLKMIQQGAAWPYFSYLRNTGLGASYISHYRHARSLRIGLWREATPEAPWDWRKRHRGLLNRLIFAIRRFLAFLFGHSR